MTRKAMSIIGRIIGLILVVALAFGITWCATHWSKVQAEWDKIFNKTPQQEQPKEPTPEEPTPDDPDKPYEHIHAYGEWKVTFAPTCADTGVETRTCSCGYFEERVISKLAHTYGDYVVTKEATCEFTGTKTRTCTKCSATQTETLPALGHDYVDGICSHCGVEHDHSFGGWETTAEATCTNDGEEQRSCSCGKVETRTISALGHNFGEWTTTTEATCESTGTKTRTCTKCSATQTETIEKINLDGFYVYRSDLESGDPTFTIHQIKGDKYNFYDCYLKNNDLSTIYLPQDYLGYFESSPHTLIFEETDEEIIIGSLSLMEMFKDDEEYFNLYKHYFVFDKQTKTLFRGRESGPVEMLKIDKFEILPYPEPIPSIEDDILHLTDMGTDGTYTIHYLNYTTGEEGDYFIGDVTEFDLTLLFNTIVYHYPGDTYAITPKFCTADGFVIKGRYSDEWITHCNHENTDTVIISEPTCETPGIANVSCSDCDKLISSESIPALGHNYVDGVCSRCNSADVS